MIPDFQSMMLPILEFIGKNGEVPVKAIQKAVIKHFNITDEEQKQEIPSGRQLTYVNRIAWAIARMKMEDVVCSPQRRIYKISDKGKKILENPPEKITLKYLNGLRTGGSTPPIIETPPTEQTPDELFELSHAQIINSLKEQLLQKIRENSSYFFEKLVLELLQKMGYGGSGNDRGELTSKGADEGIDGIIKEDKLGFDKIYIQAKKWENSVGRPDIQKFIGALNTKRAKKGVFITTSDFSKEAYDCVKNLDIAVILINGEKLSQYMVDNELGISLKRNLKTYSVDSDYFEE